MGLPLFLAAVGTAASISGQMKAGKAQEKAAKQQAKQMQIDRMIGEAQADQQMAMRMESYEYAMSESNAMFLGGQESAQQAFAEGQRKILLKDLATMSSMKKLQSSQAAIASAVEIQRGANARKASFYSALGTMGNAAFQYASIKT